MVREKEQFISKGSSKPLFIRLSLPAGEASPVPPLSANLGQVQLNAGDFCRNFNDVSLQNFDTSSVVNIRVYRKLDGTYFFKFNGINLSFMFFQASSEDFYFIDIEFLYDIFIIYCKFFNRPSNYYCANQFFGSLRSSRRFIINF